MENSDPGSIHPSAFTVSTSRWFSVSRAREKAMRTHASMLGCTQHTHTFLGLEKKQCAYMQARAGAHHTHTHTTHTPTHHTHTHTHFLSLPNSQQLHLLPHRETKRHKGKVSQKPTPLLNQLNHQHSCFISSYLSHQMHSSFDSGSHAPVDYSVPSLNFISFSTLSKLQLNSLKTSLPYYKKQTKLPPPYIPSI